MKASPCNLDLNHISSVEFHPDNLPALPGLTPRHVNYLAGRIAAHFISKLPLDIQSTGTDFYLKSDIYDTIIKSSIRDAVENKATCRKFWRRLLEKKENTARINMEAEIAALGGPKSNGEIYCSTETLERVREKRIKTEEHLAKLKVINLVTQQEIDMLTLAKNNERNRIHELYNTTVNIEKLAKELKHHWIFATLTAPPEYHPNPTKGKRSYSPELGVKASHTFISNEWKKIRARLAKQGINAAPENYFGIRTVEPHKDGCLHWHLIIFLRRNIIDTVSKEINKSFPLKHQCKIIVEEKTDSSASAATYLYKYISKSFSKDEAYSTIESDKTDQEREDKNLASYRNKERVQAALSCLGVRQYQTFGLSRITSLMKLINKLDLTQVDAEKNSALEFIKNEIWRNNEGSLNLLRARPFTSEMNRIDKALSACLLKDTVLNSYGEPKQRIIGVKIGTQEFLNKSMYLVTKK